jgi:type I restriction enzyme, S subunit
MSNISWPTAPLKSLTSKICDGIHGTPKYVEFSEYPFINGNNLNNGFINVTPETKRVAEDEYRKYFIGLDNDTLLLSINGTLGGLAKYRGETVVLGKSVAYIKCTKIFLDFLYYYFQLKNVQKCMWNEATGSTIKNLSLASIRNLQIPTPTEVVQKKIAAVLLAIDAKIEINNHINDELEAMAKNLYNFWFLQFDFPDQSGKPYKSSGGKMEYNSTLKREIPAGWEAIRLNELLQNRADSITSSKVDSHVPYTPIESLPTKKMSFGSAQPSSEANTSLIKYKKSDILIGAMRVYFHRVCIAPFEGITRTTTLILRPLKPNYLPYLYQVCNEDRTISVATKLSVGTQQPYVNWEKALENHAIPFPEDDVLIQKYSSKMLSITKEVINRERENAELTKLRDWLLPMLMNGQVTVK